MVVFLCTFRHNIFIPPEFMEVWILPYFTKFVFVNSADACISSIRPYVRLVTINQYSLR